MAGPGVELNRIETVPLRVSVADILRQAIVTGSLRPGTPIVEVALAEQLNVSRAPVREAIQILEGERLVESTPFKGKRVKPLTMKGVEELYSLREQFEIFALRRVFVREPARVAAELHPHVEAMFAAAEQGDVAALMLGDEAFHRTLIEAADHALLLAMWDTIYLHVRQIMALRNMANRDLRAVAANHPPIVEALEAGNLDDAIRLMEVHTRNVSRISPEELGIEP